MSVLAKNVPQVERKAAFRVDFPFERKMLDEQTGDIVLEGYASTWGEDRDLESMDPGAYDDTLADYLAKNPLLLFQHETDWPLGVVQDAIPDDRGLRVRALVTKPDQGELPILITAYSKIQRGVIRTFSVGGYMWRELRGDFENPEIVITKVELLEISVVAIPANQDALFGANVKKMLAGETIPLDGVLTPAVQTQMGQLLGLYKMTNAELVEMSDDERRERYFELALVYERAGSVPPALDGYKRILAGDAVKSLETADEATLRGILGSSARLLTQVLGGVKRGDSGLGSMGPALAVMGKAQEALAAQTKRGRVLSATNENRVRSIAKLAQELLDALKEEDAAADEGDGEKGLKGGAIDTPDLEGGPLSEKKVLGTPDMPFAERDRPWDNGAAKNRVHAKAKRDDGSYDPAVLRKAYLWLDDDADPTQVTGYRFIVCDLIDDTMKYVPRAVFAAANVLSGGRGGSVVPEAGQAGLRRAVERLYGKMRSAFNDDSITVPWAND